MEEQAVVGATKTMYEYGFLGVAVVGLTIILWKIVNAVWKNSTDTIERQRVANIAKDELNGNLSKTNWELTQKNSDWEHKYDIVSQRNTALEERVNELEAMMSKKKNRP